MNISELRKVIGEEVRKAMREEFRDILVEAVEVVEQGNSPVSATNTEEDDRSDYEIDDPNPIQSILQETAQNMGRGDLRNYTTGIKQGDTLSFDSGLISRPAQPAAPVPEQSVGAVDPMAALMGKAKQVYDRSLEIDKERHGV